MPRLLAATLLAALCWLLAASPAQAQRIDAARSSADFEIGLRIGSPVRGVCSAINGEIVTLEDGRLRVEMQVGAGSIEVPGNAQYTRMVRGPWFFDSERHPDSRFVSEPFPARRLREGGEIVGQLTLRGLVREERLVLRPAECERPLLDCPVLADGVIARSRYGMDGLRLVVQDEVRYRFRLLAVAEDGTTP